MENQRKHPGAKRTATQRAADLVEISKLRLAGETQERIAEILAASRPYRISRRQVGHDVALLEARWREAALSDLIVAKGLELARLAQVEAGAWQGWERSQQDRVKTTREAVKLSAADNMTAKVTTTSEGQVGDSSFLARILECVNRRCQILGLNAPAKQELSGPDGRPLAPGVVFEIPANGRDLDPGQRLNLLELQVLVELMTKAEGGAPDSIGRWTAYKPDPHSPAAAMLATLAAHQSPYVAKPDTGAAPAQECQS